jgi:hypothetical protein
MGRGRGGRNLELSLLFLCVGLGLGWWFAVSFQWVGLGVLGATSF